jgi:hypothetical protein
MLRKLLLIASLSGFLSGCAPSTSVSAPTPFPANYLPTVIQLTSESISATQLSLSTPSPAPTETPVQEVATVRPTITITPSPDIPLAAIQITSPGPASKIASPVEVRLMAIAGKSNIMELDLYGEDGRLLARTLQAFPSQPTAQYMFIKIPFEIRAAAEVGILQVSTKDEHGLIQSLSTVRVLLISSGMSQVNPAGNSIYEHVVLSQLPQDSKISGGVVNVQGQFTPLNRQPMIVELISNDGRSLGLRVLSFASTDQQSFSTTIPYKVSVTTQARLFIRQQDDVLSGPVYVYSEELYLNP